MGTNFLVETSPASAPLPIRIAVPDGGGCSFPRRPGELRHREALAWRAEAGLRR